MHLGAIAAQMPSRTAVVLGERRVSYAQLDAASRRLADWARSEGLERGQVLAVLAPNGPEFVAAVAAAQRCGLYALPIPARLTAAEIDYILDDSGAAALLLSADLLSLADRTRRGARHRPRRVLDTMPRLFDAVGAPRDPDPVEGGDMLYTSGTTGRPKGVRRPLEFSPLGSELARAQRLQELFHMHADTVFLSPAPLYHAAPLRFSMALLRIGGTLVLMPRFDAAEALRLLEDEVVTHSQWVPTMFRRLLALPAEQRGDLSAPAHRVAIHAGAPCSVSLKRQMIAWWGPILHEYYSGTESVGFTHIDSHDWLTHPGSVGRPWRCEVHVLDESGRELPPGETGVVHFSGRGTPAYHNAPEKSAQALSPQGYATLGDIGHVDEKGFLYLTDRRSFTIISGGVNVYPREVEDALLADSRVLEAAVFGIPDDDLGEAVTAVVQLADGTLAGLDTALALRGALERSLARYKLPRVIAFHAEIPLTDSGKVHKARLREGWRDEAVATYDYEALRGADRCVTS